MRTLARSSRTITKNARRCRSYRAKLRASLIALLGGKCVDCGTENDLQPDHKFPREWQSRNVWCSTRLRIYLQEAHEGKLELRCGPCNRKKGQPVDNEPF